MAPKRRQAKKATESKGDAAAPCEAAVAAAEPSAQPNAEHQPQIDEKADGDSAAGGGGSDAPAQDEQKPVRGRRASNKTGPAPARPEGVTKRSTRTRAAKEVRG